MLRRKRKEDGVIELTVRGLTLVFDPAMLTTPVDSEGLDAALLKWLLDYDEEFEFKLPRPFVIPAPIAEAYSESKCAEQHFDGTLVRQPGTWLFWGRIKGQLWGLEVPPAAKEAE